MTFEINSGETDRTHYYRSDESIAERHDRNRVYQPIRFWGLAGVINKKGILNPENQETVLFLVVSQSSTQ